MPRFRAELKLEGKTGTYVVVPLDVPAVFGRAVQVYYRTNGHSQGDFVCECSNASCVDPISLSPTEYRDVRAHPTRFFLVPGHELEEVERVVEETDPSSSSRSRSFPSGPVGARNALSRAGVEV